VTVPVLDASWAAPVPPGLRLVHASWIEHFLAELPPRARSAVANGPRDAVDVWLARWACCEIPPMTGWTCEAGFDPLAWLSERGADQLAFVAISSGTDPRRLGSAVGQAAQRIAGRTDQLGPVRAAIARCRVPADDDLRLPRIGARAVAPELDVLDRRRVILRLPRAIGIAIDGELAAHRAGLQ
jgi:hypothetical protein